MATSRQEDNSFSSPIMTSSSIGGGEPGSRRPLLINSVNESKQYNQTSDEFNETSSVIIKNCDNDDPSQAPRDRFYLVYGIMLLFGIAILLPWNVFITANDYFVNYKLNTTESQDTVYKNNFMFIIGLIGNLTNCLMNLINIFISFGGNPKNRIPYTMVLCSLVVLFQMILAIIDSQTWPFTFFILCCVSVFVMYIATGIMNSCVYYVASIFPMEYVNAIVIGNNISGIFTTFMSIVSKATAPDLRLAGIFYFLASFLVVILGLVGYFVMHKSRFYKYHYAIAERRRANQSNEAGSRIPFGKIIKKTWVLLFCIWLNFFSTLAIFPVYNLGVQRADANFFIPDKWYVDVLVFVSFNVIVTFGNLLPRLFKFPGPRYIAIPVIVRALAVFAFFALCNFMPDKRADSFIPVLIKNDYVYWAGCIISPLTFGYLTSLLMMYTPQLVEPEIAGYASMIAALMITIGVVTGLQFTIVLKMIVLA